MKIDVARFLHITAALAAMGCERGRPARAGSDDPNVIVAQAPDEPVEPAPVVVVSDAGPATEVAPAPLDAGPMLEAPLAPALAACDALSPSCEGLVESCRVLSVVADTSGEGSWGHGFVRPVAEQIASCWGAKVKPPACDERAMRRCVKDAVLKVKPDKSLDSLCTQAMSDCKRAGKPAKYTREQCLKVLSSSSGAARSEAARMLGPMGENCTLSFVLPLDPFGV